MHTLSTQKILAHRTRTYRCTPDQALKSYQDAVNFINERGVVYFWPIREVEMPSLWAATAGNRPVPDAHDDPGHVTWDWKDSMLRSGACYYAKVLRGKATMISWEYLPYFYALSENFGDPAEDHLQRYHKGSLTFEAKSIYEAILDNGPLDTITLRKKVRMTSAGSDSRFAKALTDLQKFFLLAPVDITDSGGWRYAFAYDIPARWRPDLLEQTRFISEKSARGVLLLNYLRSVGAARPQQISRLFGWPAEETRKTIADAAAHNELTENAAVAGESGSWVCMSQLFE